MDPCLAVVLIIAATMLGWQASGVARDMKERRYAQRLANAQSPTCRACGVDVDSPYTSGCCQDCHRQIRAETEQAADPWEEGALMATVPRIHRRVRAGVPGRRYWVTLCGYVSKEIRSSRVGGMDVTCLRCLRFAAMGFAR